MPLLNITLLVSLLLHSALAADTLTVKSSAYKAAVLELYTSEGCSSCPPADRWLAQLIQLPSNELDVVALAFHVDYWDYLGWKDEFASPRYSDRQRDLGRHNQQTTIYTPEFFVDGREVRNTSRILDNIRQANRTVATVDLVLKLDISGGQLQIQLASQDNSNLDPRVQFAIVEDDLSNQVKHGENAGRELKHQRVVRYLSPELGLQPLLAHSINLEPEWKRQNLGIAALVTGPDRQYLQAVYRRLE